ATPDSALRGYHQVVDMRDGIARTSYDWVNGDIRTSVRVETFVSRADPHLAGVRVTLVPHHAGRMRVRFAIAGWPPPRRLALATLERTEPSWKLDDIWYPGHMIVRGNDASLEPDGGRISMTSTPE